MKKYSVNLLQEQKKPSNRKWFFIIIVFLMVSSAIILWINSRYKKEPVSLSNKKSKSIVKNKKKEHIIKKDSIKRDDIRKKIEKKKTDDSEVKKEESIPKNYKGNKFLTQFFGYKINDIKFKDEPIATLKRDNVIVNLKKGSRFRGFNVKGIHRMHIILENENAKIHLNYIK